MALPSQTKQKKSMHLILKNKYKTPKWFFCLEKKNKHGNEKWIK